MNDVKQNMERFIKNKEQPKRGSRRLVITSLKSKLVDESTEDTKTIPQNQSRQIRLKTNFGMLFFSSLDRK